MLLSDDIIKRYYEKVNQLNKENRITKEQVLILTSTNTAMNLLERHTLNDSERFTDETPEEILREIEEDQNKKINTVNKNIQRTSHYISVVVFWLLWSIITTIFILKYIDFEDSRATTNWILYILQFITGLWGVLSWGGFIWSKANIISYLEKIIYRKRSEWLFKDN